MTRRNSVFPRQGAHSNFFPAPTWIKTGKDK